MNDTDKIIRWLRHMAELARSRHGVLGLLAEGFWMKAADRIEAGDHLEHARRQTERITVVRSSET